MNNKVPTNGFCSNCGAPLTTEICPYCHNRTGLDTKYTDMEYHVIECKEANITFWNTAFPMIFAVGFGFFGFIFPLIFIIAMPEEALSVVLMCSIFAVIGVVAFNSGIRSIIRKAQISSKGKEIEGTVYGYMDDNVILNGQPAQIVKILVTTSDGPKFILYQLGDTKKPYKINGKIKLTVYKDMFLINKDKTYYFE